MREVVVRFSRRSRSSGITQSKQLTELEGLDQVSQTQRLVINLPVAAFVLIGRLSRLALNMELKGGRVQEGVKVKLRVGRLAIAVGLVQDVGGVDDLVCDLVHREDL